MRPKRRESVGSLDSLLDTMTNVVGILVILLAVTQLGVGDAVKRIRGAMIEVSAEEFEQLQVRAAEVDELLVEQADAGAAAIKEQKVDSATLSTVNNLVAELNVAIARLSELQVEADETRALIAERQKQVDELQEKIVQTDQEVADLGEQLAGTQELEIPPDQVVRLPNPREVPKGWEEVLFMCRGGRIMPIDHDYLLKRAHSAIARTSRARRTPIIRLGQGNEDKRKGVPVDCKILTEAFEERNIGNANFRIHIEVKGQTPQLLYKLREDAGETAEEILDQRSKYRAQIRRIARNQYARFLVWPDSFEVYLAAREISEERNLAAGWELRHENSEYRRPLVDKRGGPVYCADVKPPPQQPKPKTPPKPPAPDPALEGRKVPPRDVVD